MTQPNGPVATGRGLDAWAGRLVGLIAPTALIVACFGPVLFEGHQFVFRDAGHFYYPLYLAVQRQWAAGIWPLWEPGEDGGIPLLGSPQAAVLYPGKLIYAALPYAWAARAYILAHVGLAFGATRALARSWGVSRTGATLAGLAYAFGGPVLFQHCNAIYLVGAAWAPLGFRAADGWLRLGRRWGVLELAGVLALQALGGDLEAAYVTGLCAAGYAAGLAWRRPAAGRALGGVAVLAAGWAIVGPGVAAGRLGFGPGAVRLGAGLIWGGVVLVLLIRGRRGRERSPLGARASGLAAAAGLAVTLGAIQFVPVAANLAPSDRWGEATTRAVEDFSFVPHRVVEAAWPRVFGSILAGDRYWLPALPGVADCRVWEDSIYCGALPLALALGAFGFRGGPPWRAWLSAVALVGSVAALGHYLDPAEWLGRAGGGSPYRLMAALLPGFGGFRYPSKLLVFVVLALAGLAGSGWDRVVAGQARRATIFLAAVVISSLALLAEVGLSRGAMIRTLMESPVGGTGSMFGPFDPRGAWADVLGALGHGGLAALLALAVIRPARRRPVGAGLAAVLLVGVDLAVADRAMVFTRPQGEFDRPSAVARIIAAAEAERPTEGGRFRVFRLPGWSASTWSAIRSPTDARRAEAIRWERDTLLPNFGLVEGIESTRAQSGAVEHGDFEAFFRPYYQQVDAATAAALGIRAGQDVYCYPRPAFDLWNTRYFLLPTDPGDWTRGNRALISFLARTERVYPRADPDPTLPRLDDFQVRRNLDACPRAWTVHDLVAVGPGAPAAERAAEHLAKGPGVLPGAPPPGLVVAPRTAVLVEAAAPEALAPYRSLAPVDPAEAPRITLEAPGRVELEVALKSPGLVVLGHRFDPGWHATVDGRPAPILKANHLMRAVAVGAGPHRIVYRYDPWSFRVGAGVSALALVPLGLACAWAARGPRQTLR